jgi:propanol-preferring alcohol dehydrogenase
VSSRPLTEKARLRQYRGASRFLPECSCAVAAAAGGAAGIAGFCLGGQEQLCDGARWAALGPDGGYADYLLVPATRHLLPAGRLDLVKAAGLTDAGLSSYRAVKKALPYLLAGTAAVVIGAGGLGQYGVQYLKLMTSATAIAVRPHRSGGSSR